MLPQLAVASTSEALPQLGVFVGNSKGFKRAASSQQCEDGKDTEDEHHAEKKLKVGEACDADERKGQPEERVLWPFCVPGVCESSRNDRACPLLTQYVCANCKRVMAFLVHGEALVVKSSLVAAPGQEHCAPVSPRSGQLAALPPHSLSGRPGHVPAAAASANATGPATAHLGTADATKASSDSCRHVHQTWAELWQRQKQVARRLRRGRGPMVLHRWPNVEVPGGKVMCCSCARKAFPSMEESAGQALEHIWRLRRDADHIGEVVEGIDPYPGA